MAFFTVLKNAVELTPDKGNVAVSVSGDANRIQVTVSDSEYCIPTEETDAVFDPFYTCGFGLGLPLIKQIVSEHMGEISVRSGISEGTTVTMVFPVRWGGITFQAG